jgi:hypothetical protein
MIVQSVTEGGLYFVIAMRQHTALAGSLASNFGNDTFVGLDPREPMQFVVDHHDQGWAELDAGAPQDPETGLPFNLTATPLRQAVKTSAGSPAFNEAHHPFSGMISSMHSYGLYHGRYGLSDKISVKLIPEELRSDVDAMLAAEEDRQVRLKAQLAVDDPEHASDEYLFHAYKQLQFFDTFSLYLHLTPQGSRGESEFANVPRSVGDDVTITVTEREGGVYALDPYPFAVDELSLATQGRYLTPQPAGADLSRVLASTAISEQRVRLVAAS